MTTQKYFPTLNFLLVRDFSFRVNVLNPVSVTEKYVKTFKSRMLERLVMKGGGALWVKFANNSCFDP